MNKNILFKVLIGVLFLAVSILWLLSAVLPETFGDLSLAWLIATLCFAFIQLLIPTATKTWLSFVIAVPVTMIILLVLTSVWGKTLTNMFITSGLVWSVIATLYIVLLNKSSL